MRGGRQAKDCPKAKRFWPTGTKPILGSMIHGQDHAFFLLFRSVRSKELGNRNASESDGSRFSWLRHFNATDKFVRFLVRKLLPVE